MDMDKMDITISLRGRYGEFSAGKTIHALYYQCFEPLASGDVPIISAINKEVSEDEVKMKMKIRKNTADIIAKEIAEFLVNAMKSKDTHNGYPVER